MSRIINLTAAFPSMDYQIKKIGLKDYTYFRTESFDRLILSIKDKFLKITNANNHKVALLTSSGTGVMDCALNNFISPNDKVLVIVGGRFGQLWAEMCAFYKIKTCIYRIIPGTNPIDLQEKIKQYKPTVLLIQHNETSVMQLYNINKIGKLCKKYGIKLIVDACSSFAIDSIDVNKDNIDVLIFSSQKGLVLPAGLGFIIYNKELFINPKNFYLNLNKYSSNTFVQPFTPPVTLINQLDYRLNQIIKLSINKWIKKSNKQANHFRTLIKNLPVKIIPKNLTNCGTVIGTFRKDNLDFCKYLQRKNIYIVNSRGFWGDYLSIGHIGNITELDNLIFVKELKKWLKK